MRSIPSHSDRGNPEVALKPDAPGREKAVRALVRLTARQSAREFVRRLEGEKESVE